MGPVRPGQKLLPGQPEAGPVQCQRSSERGVGHTGGSSYVHSATGREEVFSPLLDSNPKVLADCRPGRLGQFEFGRPAGLLLSDSRAVGRIVARRNVIDLYGYEVAAAQLAFDGDVEQRQIARSAFDLELGSDLRDVLRTERRLCADARPSSDDPWVRFRKSIVYFNAEVARRRLSLRPLSSSSLAIATSLSDCTDHVV